MIFIVGFAFTSIQAQQESDAVDQTVLVESILDSDLVEEDTKSIFSSHLDFQLYPNPAQNYIRIKNPSSDQVRYRILDLTGEQVSEGFIQSEKERIPLDDFNNGIYLIQLESKIGVKTIRFNKAG